MAQPHPRAPDAYLLAGRLLLVALYLPSASGKWADLPGLASTLADKGFPVAMAFALVAAAAELLGALAVAAGFLTRSAAIGLVAYSALATGFFHDFWTLSDHAAREAQFMHFMKNVGLIGGFLLLAGAGPSRWSLDARLGAVRPKPGIVHAPV